MTSAGTRKRPAPAEPPWTEATFSVKRKMKKNRDRGPVRLIENWCRPCISRLVQDPNHRCSNQTGTGWRCVDCLDKKSNCDALPRIAIPAAKAALAAAEAVEDKDEDSLHVFTTAATKARRVVLANPKNRNGNPPSKSATATTTTRTITAGKVAAATAGDGIPEWAAKLLELGSRIFDRLEAMDNTQIAYLLRKQDDEDDDDDRDEDGDYEG